jgi:hypothetical protein
MLPIPKWRAGQQAELLSVQQPVPEQRGGPTSLPVILGKGDHDASQKNSILWLLSQGHYPGFTA